MNYLEQLSSWFSFEGKDHCKFFVFFDLHVIDFLKCHRSRACNNSPNSFCNCGDTDSQSLEDPLSSMFCLKDALCGIHMDGVLYHFHCEISMQGSQA